jgi:hypothetical protein
MMVLTRVYLFHHCRLWRKQYAVLQKTERKVMGWNAGRYRHVQVSELISMEE